MGSVNGFLLAIYGGHWSRFLTIMCCKASCILHNDKKKERPSICPYQKLSPFSQLLRTLLIAPVPCSSCARWYNYLTRYTCSFPGASTSSMFSSRMCTGKCNRCFDEWNSKFETFNLGFRLCWYYRGSYCDNSTIRCVAFGRIGYRVGQARDNDAVHKDRVTANIEKNELKNLNLQPAS